MIIIFFFLFFGKFFSPERIACPMNVKRRLADNRFPHLRPGTLSPIIIPYIPLAGSLKHSHIVCLYLNNNCNSFHRHMSRSLGCLFLAKHLPTKPHPHAHTCRSKPSWTKECAGQTKDLGNKLEFGTMKSSGELQSKNSVIKDLN